MKQTALQATAIRLPHTILREQTAELEILYIKVEINNAVVLELDKLNFVFVLNGKDMLAQIRSQC